MSDIHNNPFRITLVLSSGKPNAAGGIDRFFHYRLSDGKRDYIARCWPDGRIECCTASDKPLNPKRDGATIAAITSCVQKRWRP